MKTIAKVVRGSKIHARPALILTAVLMVLLLSASTNAWGQQVLNIYFCGTSVTKDGPEMAWGGQTVAHEVVSWLYDIDTSSPDLLSSATHHKIILDGVGTHGCFVSLAAPSAPSSIPFACRGWAQILYEAQLALYNVLVNHPGQDVILNLVGFSRGAISTMMMARWVVDQQYNSDPGIRAYYERTKRINIIAFEPVVGDSFFNNQNLCLDDKKVERYVAFYAEDERSFLFTPSIPDFDPGKTKAWMARVPGSHETLVGNPQTDGRAFWPNIVCDWCPDPNSPSGGHYCNCRDDWDPFLLNVSWVTRVMATELLKSHQWGHVTFNANYSDAHNFNFSWDGQYNTFASKVGAIWNGWDYGFMRGAMMTPFGLESYRNELLLGWGCWLFDPVVGNSIGLQHEPRCSFRWDCGGSGENSALTWRMDIPRISVSYAWTALDELGSNRPPIANAGPDQTVYANATCLASVALDGSGSSDPDGDFLTYSWTGSFGAVSGMNPTVTLGLGVHTITLNVSDGEKSGTDTVNVTVTDTSPPTITCPANIEKSTDPGQCTAVVNYTVTAIDNCSGVTVVSNPPSGSAFPKDITTVTSIATDKSDNTAICSFTATVKDKELPVLNLPGDIVVSTDSGKCSAMVNYVVSATDNCLSVTVASNPPSGSAFDKGTATVAATAIDASGNIANGSFKVTVEDRENPIISNVSVSHSVLWPPNHKMVPVTVNASASDNCGENPVCRITSVSSNEPENGLGDGDMSPDWEITGDFTVNLRAERSGKGSGRIYTITVMCADPVGNSLTKTVAVTVPHDQGKNK